MQTEEFMKRRYEFRYNTQIAEVEYRERLSFRFRFNPLDKRALNSIALDAQMRVFHCGTGISAVISIQIACLYSIRWRIFSIDFPDGTVKTVSVNWQLPFLAGIRIGQTCFTAGFSIWFLIGEGMIKIREQCFAIVGRGARDTKIYLLPEYNATFGTFLLY